MTSIEVSVIIPVFNEAGNVPELCNQLVEVLGSHCSDFEIIFVAGGSSDGTEQIVMQEHLRESRVKLLWLSRNFGHQQALAAGLDHASGNAVIAMDGDLQHPPGLIPELLMRWREGFRVVVTQRSDSADAGVLDRATSRWFYRAINALSGLDLTENSADFCLLDRAAVRVLCQLPERSRFLRGLVHWIGFPRAVVTYSAPSRLHGRSKFSLVRRLKLAMQATIAFSAAPLYLVALLGCCLASLSLVYGVYAIAARLILNVPVDGWASVLTMVAFLGGVQLISLGVAGAYIARIYDDVKARPIYLVQQAHGFGRGSDAQPSPHLPDRG